MVSDRGGDGYLIVHQTTVAKRGQSKGMERAGNQGRRVRRTVAISWAIGARWYEVSL